MRWETTMQNKKKILGIILAIGLMVALFISFGIVNRNSRRGIPVIRIEVNNDGNEFLWGQ